MSWLYDKYKKGVKISEQELSKKLLELRSEESEFISHSFEPIIGSGKNSSIIHYNCQHEQNMIDYEKPLLIDSGGHYKMGTTDITRTIQINQKVNYEIQDYYSYVLQGNITLEQQKFPNNTTGGQIDILARQFLYQQGLDYGHGTGHGIGFVLGVHEGPIAISKTNNSLLKLNMLLSNEPGFYLDNQFGIRIENNLIVQKYNHSFSQFYNLTLVPYATNLINPNILTTNQIQYINNYHFHIQNIIGQYLLANNFHQEYEYLLSITQPL